MSRIEELYTAERIGAALARRTFDGMLCVVDRCMPRPFELEYELRVRRRATPNRKCSPLTHEVVVDIARLASLRMWDAYEAVSRLGRGCSRHGPCGICATEKAVGNPRECVTVSARGVA